MCVIAKESYENFTELCSIKNRDLQNFQPASLSRVRGQGRERWECREVQKRGWLPPGSSAFLGPQRIPSTCQEVTSERVDFSGVSPCPLLHLLSSPHSLPPLIFLNVYIAFHLVMNILDVLCLPYLQVCIVFNLLNSDFKNQIILWDWLFDSTMHLWFWLFGQKSSEIERLHQLKGFLSMWTFNGEQVQDKNVSTLAADKAFLV